MWEAIERKGQREEKQGGRIKRKKSWEKIIKKRGEKEKKEKEEN